jgi:nitrogen fixation-related uncharacterized protein
MRPKKSVLVVGVDELLASQVVVRLHVWGYRSEQFDDMESALMRLREREFDLVLIMGTCFPGDWGKIDQLVFPMLDIQSNRGHNLRIFDPANFLPHGIATGVQRVPVLPFGRDVWTSLRETVRLTAGRKRGPRSIPAEYRATERVA